MKREVLCPTCAANLRKLFPTDNPYPGEYVKFVTGRASKDCICDGCIDFKPIKQGEPAVAFSSWDDYHPYSPWESEFLTQNPEITL
jgi:hypothetical protein